MFSNHDKDEHFVGNSHEPEQVLIEDYRGPNKAVRESTRLREYPAKEQTAVQSRQAVSSPFNNSENIAEAADDLVVRGLLWVLASIPIFVLSSFVVALIEYGLSKFITNLWGLLPDQLMVAIMLPPSVISIGIGMFYNIKAEVALSNSEKPVQTSMLILFNLLIAVALLWFAGITLLFGWDLD